MSRQGPQGRGVSEGGCGGGEVRKAERKGYRPDVNVGFQKKAWGDDELGEGFGGKEVNGAMGRARGRGRPSHLQVQSSRRFCR